MRKITHKEEIICDMCCKPITKLLGDGYFGRRFTMRKGILSKPVHADICFDCQQRIIEMAKREEGAKDEACMR